MSMKIPRSVIIMGLTYQIKTVKNDEWVGHSDLMTQNIYLAKGITLERQWEVLFHEIVETILASMNCLRDDSMDKQKKTIMLDHCPEVNNDIFIVFCNTLLDTLKRNNLMRGVV